MQGIPGMLNGHGYWCRDEIVPRLVDTLSKRRVKRIAGGWRHTIAGDDKGQLWSFGWNKVSSSKPVVPL